MKDGQPVIWKDIDKDGMNMPARLQQMLPANNQRAAPGTTHDFAFTPDKEGVYFFEAKMDEKAEVTQMIRVSK